MITQEKIRALQDILQTTMSAQFDLPRIVVLGSQSSGKSSVLEQILQKDFLPRGNNLVTRCPIIISLKKSEVEMAKVDGAEVSFEDLPKKLIETMNKNCGNDKGIVDKPINVQLNMCNTLDMMLIDLPGLTKIPIGDQPPDIEHQILNMAKKYISGDNTLILCTISANADIATSESLKVAKEIDSGYDRTIGVLTKIDLMDAGTDCTEVLDNTYPRLKYGYVGVINRSQQDINRGLSIRAAIEKEEKMFSESEAYKKYGDKIGSRYLLRKLCDIFSEIFDRELPRIKLALRNALEDLHREKELLDSENKTRMILNDYNAALGNFFGINRDSSFACSQNNIISQWCNEITNHSCHVPLDDIGKYISDDQCLFLPDKGFEDKVRDSTKKITDDLILKSTKIFSKLIGSIEEIKHHEYQSAAMFLNEFVIGKLKTQFQIFTAEVKRQNMIQNDFVNMAHPDFGKQEIITKKIMDRIKNAGSVWGKNSENNVLFDFAFIKELVGNLVYAYTNIYVRDIKDICVKLIQSKINMYVREKIMPDILLMESNVNLIAESNEEAQIKNDLNRDIEKLTSALMRLGVDPKNSD